MAQRLLLLRSTLAVVAAAVTALALTAAHGQSASGDDGQSPREYVPKPIDPQHWQKTRDADGILSYTVAVRAMDGSGPQRRGVEAADGAVDGVRGGKAARCAFPVTKTGDPAATTEASCTVHLRDTR